MRGHGRALEMEDREVGEDKTTFDKVADIICEQMNVDKAQIKTETSFVNDLGADSLDTVELVMEFEEKFGMQIPDEEAEKIRTVGDAVAYIDSHKK